MYLVELLPGRVTTAISFANPHATNYEEPGEAHIVQGVFHIAEHSEPITDLARPKHFYEAVGKTGITLVTSEGGDNMVNRTVTAMMGHVDDDPTTTAHNRLEHAPLLRNTLYVPLAKGNANLFARSALGLYAVHPELLATAPDLYIGQHYPLEFKVLGIDDKVLRTGIVISCIGLNASAEIMNDIEASKQSLRRLPRPVRAGVELGKVVSKLWEVEPFLGYISYHSGNPDVQTARSTLIDLAGFEVIGTYLYAKGGHSPVNMDDTYQQVGMDEYQPNPALRALGIPKTLGKVARGKYDLPPVDLTNGTLSITAWDRPVAFHVDGTIDPGFVLLPGQTLQITQSELAINVLMRQRYAVSNRPAPIRHYRGKHTKRARDWAHGINDVMPRGYVPTPFPPYLPPTTK